MDKLIKTLSQGAHPVEAKRSEKSVEALKRCIDREYVHILFKETGSELGMKLDRSCCKFKEEDFGKKKGNVHLEGGLTFNYTHVKLVADINLETLEGKGYLLSLNNE